MKRLALLALALAACTSEDNLGNHVFGDARWSISIGSPGQEAATALAIDPIGNVIVAGTCAGSVKFGTTRQDCYGSFISQRAYDTGAEQWTAMLQGARVTSLNIDELGYVIATGSYSGNANIAGTPLATSGIDPFIAVFNASGALEGVAALGMDGTAIAPVGAIEPDGCVYITGGFHGTMPTPDGTISNTSGELDGFVAGHFADTSGAWTVRLSGEGDQVGRALAVQGEHLAVIAGTTGAMDVGTQTINAAPPSQLLQFAVDGRLQWTQPLIERGDHLAVSRTGDIVVAGADDEHQCMRLRAFDVAGRERWTTTCESRLYGALAIDVQGTLVSGGSSSDPNSGELFLAAVDADGNSIGSVQAQPYPYERDSSLDGIAIEPSGEVAFIASINHPFDFGLGMVPFAGQHDVAIVKLDSPRGEHDGPVVLLRK